MLAPIAVAQIDIQVSTAARSPYIVVGRGLTWGSSGTGGANNYFIFQPLSPDQRYCVFIVNNNPTSSHTYTLAAYQTGDPSQGSFQNNSSGRWIQDTVQGNAQTVSAASTTSAYVHANAGARMAISLTGSTTQTGSPDTADIFIVQTTAESCGPVQQGVPLNGVFCSNSAAGSFTGAASTGTIIINGAAGKSIYLCSASLAVLNGATAQYVSIIYGTGANCTGGSFILSIPVPASNTLPVVLGYNVEFQVPTALNVCVQWQQTLPTQGGAYGVSYTVQ